MTRKTLSGLSCAIAVGIAIAAPSAGHAQGPLGAECNSDTTVDLSPVARVNIKTCDLAVAPECANSVFTTPSNPVIRLEVTTCL